MAWDTGVIVPQLRGKELDGPASRSGLDNGILNTVGYLTSRYGKLHLHDLDLLTRNSVPYQAADRGRQVGTTVPIDRSAMTAYFKTVDLDPDAPMISAHRLAKHIAAAAELRDTPATPDDMDKIRAWASSRHDGTAARSA